MEVKVQKGDSFIGRYFPGITGADMVPKFHHSKGVPIAMACSVVKNLPPRDEEFEYVRDMGMGFIQKIFAKEKISNLGNGVLTFVFPERWMSVQEQVYFTSAIEEHPQANDIKAVFIITSSPLIIGNFEAKQVRIITFPDKKLYVAEE